MENRLKFFYCYSGVLKDFIKSQGIQYIKKDINPVTGNLFFLFEQSEKLGKVLDKWRMIKDM